MTWMGPTYGMWADTVEQMDEIIALANLRQKSLQQWQEYAGKLEGHLTTVNDMYRRKVGDERAQARLKDLALEELKRVDPSNKLLDPEYRKQIGAEVRAATAKELKEGKKS